MELDENDLKNLRINETYILKQFISFCENNNLKYFMAFGSLLGTIRHQGFIPWDDDIDVMMPRKDYDKFIDCFMATKRNDLFLQTHITDSEFQYNYAKIRLNNTVFLEVGSNHSSIHNEIFIDIFPMDNVKKDNISKIQHKIYMFFYCLFMKEQKNYNSLKERIIGFLNNFCLILFGRKKMHKIYDRIVKKYKSGNYWALLTTENFDIVFSADYNEKTLFKNFENIRVSVPAEYEIILEKLYGNWHELPPAADRFPHHSILEYKYLEEDCELFK